jgi:hypothetical protein
MQQVQKSRERIIAISYRSTAIFSKLLSSTTTVDGWQNIDEMEPYAKLQPFDRPAKIKATKFRKVCPPVASSQLFGSSSFE